jgi:CRISPR-associated protein Cas1
MKDRRSIVFLERGHLDVIDGAFVLVDRGGVRTHIPVGGIACLMLEPGIRVSHAAVKLATRVGCLLVWIGEAGVRLYSAGRPNNSRSDRLLYQARLALDDTLRLKVVRKMFEVRFGTAAPAKRSIDQLRGIEGARVRKLYQQLAQRHRVQWVRRDYDPANWQSADLPNTCLSAATASLYGITEAAILAAGYSPAIGFLHSGKRLSFVYDIADLVKFETVVPAAFSVAGKNPKNPERAVRLACRDSFRETRLLQRLIPLIDEVLAAAEPPPVVEGTP